MKKITRHSHFEPIRGKHSVALMRIYYNIVQYSCLLASLLLSSTVFAQATIDRKKPVYNKEQLRITSPMRHSFGKERSSHLRSRPKIRTTVSAAPTVPASAPIAIAPAPQVNPAIESYTAPRSVNEDIFRTQPVPEPALSAQRSYTAPKPLIPPQQEVIVQNITVPPAPVIKEVTQAPDVTFFDATASGTAPSYKSHPAHTAVEATPMLDNAQELTRESEHILETLPTDIFPYKPEDAIQGFDIDREDAQRGLSANVHFDSTEPVEAGIKIEQQNLDVNYELEKAYNALLKGNTEIAVHVYNNILDTYPENRHALFGLATTYHKLGFLDKARPLYGKILSSNPYDKEALNNFLALVGEEAPDSAIAYLEQLKQSNNDFSPIYAQLASLYNKEQMVEKAVLNMQQAVALSPSNMVYMYNLAVIYDTNRDYRRAEMLYRQIIKAGLNGEEIPVSIQEIQERLTYLASN